MELQEAVKWIRVWNRVGAPIRRQVGMQQLRLTCDAGTGYGYRLDGEARQWQLGPTAYARAGDDLSVASCSANLWVDRAMMLVLRLAWKTRHLGAQARTGTDRGEVQ